MDRAIKFWIQQLVDPSRRNNLLFYRDTQTTTLRLDGVDAAARDRLLQGRPVSLDEFVDPGLGEDEQEAQLADLRKRATTIYRTAQGNNEEAGLDTLYLAIGFATWVIGGTANDRPPASPVLLMPVRMSPHGQGSLRNFTLEPSGEVVVNPVLLHALGPLGVTVSEITLLSGIPGLEDGDPGLQSPDEAQSVFERLTTAAQGLRGFKVVTEYSLANFQYYKMAMVADLSRHRDALIAHPIIAAIAGDGAARREAVPRIPEPNPREFDGIQARAQNLILDADASQESAVRHVLAGHNLVIQGPPGTGKSQTIANLMAALTAEGKRVLFVAEKRAALDAVNKRLRACGLGHLVFDLHGRGITRKVLAAQILEALTKVRDSQPDNGNDLYRTHDRSKDTLVQHARRMHGPRSPTGRSVYELRSVILGSPEAARVICSWSDADVGELSAKFAVACDLLDDLKQYEDLHLGTSASPWASADVTETSVGDALAAAETTWRAWQNLTEKLDGAGLRPQGEGHLAQVHEFRRRLSAHLDATEAYRETVWSVGFDELSRRLRPGLGSALKRIWALMSNADYRSARKVALSHRSREARIWTDVSGEIARALAAHRAWHVATGAARPPARGSVEAVHDALVNFVESLHRLRSKVSAGLGDESSWKEVGDRIRALATDRQTPYRRALMSALLVRCSREVRPLKALLTEISRDRVPATLWIPAFQHALAHAAYGHVASADSAVQGFDGRTHDSVTERFQKADRDLLPAAAQRVVREHGRHFIAVCNEHEEQSALVRHEAAKQSRHQSLRTLLDEAPDVLTALFPCWLASPLTVSQLLAGGTYFDVVLFDEASQVFPHDAVPSILRGKQLVVAGDRHQLPPTAFFATGDEGGNGDDAGAAEGFESLLDQVSAFLPASMLQWHYRSQDEKLIAFSNRHIYNWSLITFPGSGRDPQPLRAEVIPFRSDAPESTVSGSDEVVRVVELILAHATERPEESLGVIAPGIEHARRLEFQLDQQLSLRPDLEEFFDPNREERFFIKNLERVQGDERDAIIFSVGYSKDRGGSLSHQFGPINQGPGHRRLNVAVSRARRRMTVMSSFRWDEVDLRKSSGKGVKFLKDYLRFAESGGVILGDEGEQPVPLNPFERDVFDELTRAGLDMAPQYGSSKYRIDMVAAHPLRPGRYTLAIECDGASYHSAPIARERDRLRQEVLERLGWRFHRIWSTDWWNHREREVERTLAAFQAAWQAIDDEDASWLDGASSPAAPDERAEHPPVPAPRRDDQRPWVARGLPITEYEFRDLVKLAEYLRSDGRLYTDAELVELMAKDLGFKRKGRRIVDALTRAIHAAR
ncbi:MAG: AAA domain-containing protein [Longimicrobiales bacterium]|nr:AAA domain-containing protein [Longimicrobiales bacterium]